MPVSFIPWRGFAAAMVAVFAFALALRLGVTAAFVGLDAPPSASANPDQLDYELFAWRLARGHGFTLDDGTPTARRPPGTSFILAPIYAVTGRSFTAARLGFCTLSALTCAATGVLGAMAFGRRVGVMAACGLALYPGHFYYAMHLLSETPYAWWVSLAAIATLAAVRRESWPWGAIAGGLWALAILTRPQVLLLPLLACPLALVWRPQRRVVLAHCVAGMVVLMPWVVRNAAVMDRPGLTTGFGHVMWGAHNDLTFTDPAWRGRWVATSRLLKDASYRGDESGLDRHAMTQAKAKIAEHVASLPTLLVMKLVRLIEPVHDTPNRAVRLAFTVGWGATGLLLLPGAVLAWRRDRHATTVLLLPLAATVLMTLLTYGLDRFRDGAAPLFMPLAALSLMTLSRAALRTPTPRRGDSPAWATPGHIDRSGLHAGD